MPAKWSPFIDEVSDILENRGSLDAKDFGKKLANAYLTAIKGNATCVPGMAAHETSAGEAAFVASYEQWFHDLYEKGEPTMLTPDNEKPLVNQKDNLIAYLATEAGSETRLTIAGKDNDPEYNKLEGEIGEGIQYEPTEELDKYLEEYKDDGTESLYRFKFFEFHRLDGKETPDELARIFATRLLMQFEDISDGDKRWDFWHWATWMGTNKITQSTVGGYTLWEINDMNDNRDAAISTLMGLDWSWQSFKSSSNVTVTNTSGNYNGEFYLLVSKYVIDEIKKCHPIVDSNGEFLYNEETAIKKDSIKAIEYPWPFDTTLPVGYEEMEPAEKLKVRYPFKLTNLKIQEPFNENKKMPPVLTQNVITEFTWNGKKDYGFKKTKVKPVFIEDELRKKWQGCPLTESDETQNSIVNIDMSKTGTLAKQIRNTLIVEMGIEAAMLAEGGSKDDPYKELAKATLKYWKDATIQPFATDPPTPPCLSVPVLLGKYIGVSYGNQKKLADNIRRALNSGKDSDNAHEAAEIVAKALAYSYFTHLSQMKFIYMGGIPVPLVPYIPMIGFDATVI
tara:strand:- start:1439 stop:3130 length:1692 start_codon:yes stop_codon:yes gene_type:complete